MSSLTLSYFFDGDPTLPFTLAPMDAPPAELAADRLERLFEWLDDRKTILGSLEKDVDITGPVHIAEGSIVQSGCQITGPVYIGANCSIRHGAQVRQGTILGDECVVGHSAEIKNSVCMSGAKMQSGVFVGDSVLGRGARLGSGVILTNRRFAQDLITIGGGDTRFATDTQFFGAIVGDYARLGANAVTAPGTLIGPYTWITSLASVYGFIPREKLVMVKQSFSITDKPGVPLRSGRGEYEK